MQVQQVIHLVKFWSRIASKAMSPKGFRKLFMVGYCWAHLVKFIREHRKLIPVELVPTSVLVSKQWEVIDNARMDFITDDDTFFKHRIVMHDFENWIAGVCGRLL